MTESDAVSRVVLDAWAWWEILRDTPKGRKLSRKCLETSDVMVHTSALAVGELVAKLESLGERNAAAGVLDSLRAHATLHGQVPGKSPFASEEIYI